MMTGARLEAARAAAKLTADGIRERLSGKLADTMDPDGAAAFVAEFEEAVRADQAAADAVDRWHEDVEASERIE